MRDCIEQLKALKTHPEAGWAQSDVVTDSKNQLMSAIRNQGEQSGMEPLTVGGYVKWTVLNMVVRPIGVGTAIFALLIGGWMTTANAAANSLPGDALYGLKLVTERAQLTISSLDRRAILHTEFAERRLHEVAALDVGSEYLEDTWEAFRTEMKMAGDELVQLRDSGDENVISVATAIDKKLDDLNNGISELPTDVNTQETMKVAQEVSESAVDVLVGEHEQSESVDSEKALAESFKNQYNDLIARQTFDLGRISVIEKAINDGTVDGTVLGDENIYNLNFLINDATESVSKAMNLAAASGYRAAFEIMREADVTLLDIEARLAVIEIKITNQIINQSQNSNDTTEVVEETAN